MNAPKISLLIKGNGVPESKTIFRGCFNYFMAGEDLKKGDS
jgi:hypothetical protein